MTTDERFLLLRCALKAAGLRHTTPRDRLLRAFVACGKPVSVQELIRLEGGQHDWVTVYRLLSDLYTLDLAIRFVRKNNTFEFALREEGDMHVHHLVCEQCGRREPFYGGVIEDWLETHPAPSGFQVEYHLLTLYGTCRACLGNVERK